MTDSEIYKKYGAACARHERNEYDRLHAIDLERRGLRNINDILTCTKCGVRSAHHISGRYGYDECPR